LRIPKFLAGIASVAVLVAACSSGASPTPAPTTAPTEAPTAAPTAAPTEAPSVAPTEAPSPTAAPVAFKACQVSDTGGIDDKGFNANAWKGMQDAAAALGVEVKFLESKAETDYERNLQQFIDEKCDMIVTVGFLLGDATKKFAEANPLTEFAIVDYAYDPKIQNVAGLVFQTDEAAMLAGYLAAGMSKSGKIGTFGGINIPPVTIFMNGLAAGINYYNQEKGTKVELLGWDPTANGGKGDGTFTGDFSDKDKGKQVTLSFIQEGADIIVPVAGPVGLGAAAAVQENKDNGVMLIGVDTDQFVSAPEYGNVTLTSILKRIDNAVANAVKASYDNTFMGGVYNNTLANEGVGLAPYHDFESAVPADLTSAIDALKAKIISGEVKVSDYLAPK
jgi:basic membrane protein A